MSLLNTDMIEVSLVHPKDNKNIKTSNFDVKYE